MHQRLFHSLTAAVFVSAVGAALPSHAQQVDRLEELLHLNPDTADVFPDTASPDSALSDLSLENLSENAGAETLPSETAANPEIRTLSRRSADLVIVISHPLDDRQAATLYVQNIPVLTFIGSELATLSDTKATAAPDLATDTATVDADPVVQATAIAALIEAFHQAEGDATAISVRWDADQETYVIALADDDLVTVDETVMLPDTTNNEGMDALQATNRLRRLLGGADPLQSVEGQPTATDSTSNWNVVSVVTGRASWYGPGFHGRRTANGEVFNQNALTAAHRTLPFGTVVRVTNVNNNRQVVVRINDRGPFSGGRILDLSAGAAREIGLDRAGVGPVRIEVLSTP
ncbi:septal ring lytic transglycosylase RlpA family protein [Leptolyngbya sp. PCC 6406]|uniref:septal ring lytic transglycosylase RlpA family protein n=1 Tax=Leptolyngbya sp. PCC 6406 TaxID=1173264 RepID=UPI0002AC8F25|nr:septal ring lytic transglycosylase RlpA family protein [Leptolyngbya sp. PCC 6406]